MNKKEIKQEIERILKDDNITTGVDLHKAIRELYNKM